MGSNSLLNAYRDTVRPTFRGLLILMSGLGFRVLKALCFDFVESTSKQARPGLPELPLQLLVVGLQWRLRDHLELPAA